MEAEALEKLLDTGAALGREIRHDGLVPLTIVPVGYTLQSLEQYQTTPTRIKQSVLAYDADSFVKYFVDYCNPDSRVFYDIQTPKIIGVIDYHAQQDSENTNGPTPKWNQHTVQFGFRPSKEWSIWSAKSKHAFSQADFAAFIEENLPDIVSPASADMVQIAKTFEIKKNINFSSDTRLENGQVQLTYEEEIRGTASKGAMEIPTSIKLGIAPYEGTDNYSVEARLRYRLKEGQLSIWYELVRPHKVIEDAVKTILDRIKQGITNPITFGALS